MDSALKKEFEKQITNAFLTPDAPAPKPEDTIYITRTYWGNEPDIIIEPMPYGFMVQNPNRVLYSARSYIPGIHAWMLSQFPKGTIATASIRNYKALKNLLKAGYLPTGEVKSFLKTPTHATWLLYWRRDLDATL